MPGLKSLCLLLAAMHTVQVTAGSHRRHRHRHRRPSKPVTDGESSIDSSTIDNVARMAVPIDTASQATTTSSKGLGSSLEKSSHKPTSTKKSSTTTTKSTKKISTTKKTSSSIKSSPTSTVAFSSPNVALGVNFSAGLRTSASSLSILTITSTTIKSSVKTTTKKSSTKTTSSLKTSALSKTGTISSKPAVTPSSPRVDVQVDGLSTQDSTSLSSSSESLTSSSTTLASSLTTSLTTSFSGLTSSVLPTSSNSSISTTKKTSTTKSITTPTTKTTKATTIKTTTTKKSTAKATGKRGLAYNDPKLTQFFGPSKTKTNSQVSWTYNWYLSPCQDFPNVFSCGYNSALQFIPMLYSSNSMFTSVWSAAVEKALSSYNTKLLFSFNEPDGCFYGSSCMNMTDALVTFKKYMTPFSGRALIGAPAVTNAGAPHGLTWLTQFLDSCHDCKIDFINVHWYANKYAGATYFKQFVNQTRQVANGKPIFITEFALTDDEGPVSQAENEAFLKDVMGWMDAQKDIMGYSYFMTAPGMLATNSSLGRSSLGKVYDTWSTGKVVGSLPH